MAVAAFVVAAGLVHRGGTTNTGGLGTPVSPFTENGSSPSAPSAPSPSTGPGSLSSTDVSTIAAKVDRGVVDINTQLGYAKGKGAGTGMVLTSTGEVLTNNHVVDGATRITATVVTTGRTYTASVVGTDPTDDVAVIRLQGASGLETITAAKSSSVAVGDPVVAVGNAGGRGGTPSVVTGTVVALNQTITASDDNGRNARQLTNLVEVDAPIEAGDSGGPLVDRTGAVIGMDSAAQVSGHRFQSTTSAGYAIPIDKAVSVAQQIEAGKASTTVHIGLPAFLGVQVAGDAGQGLGGGGAGSGGALVTGVEPNTAASGIGLQAGDTITSVNGNPVGSASDLTARLRAARPGDQVTIGWTDQSGTQHTARARLTTGPAD